MNKLKPIFFITGLALQLMSIIITIFGMIIAFSNHILTGVISFVMPPIAFLIGLLDGLLNVTNIAQEITKLFI